MSSKAYRQYFPGEIREKIICSLKKGTISDVDDLPDEWYKQSKDDFRQTHLSIIDYSEDIIERVNPLEYRSVSVSKFELGTDKDALDHMRIFFGKVSRWHLVRASIDESSCLLDYYRYDVDGSVSGWFQYLLLYPLYVKLRIDIEADEIHPFETFYITLQNDRNGKNNSIEYYENETKQYTSVVIKEGESTYELITEA